MTKAKLSDLKQDRNNARKHNPRNIGMVANAIREVGVARSGVIDEDGNILAGNGTFEALAEAGIENIKIVKANGNEWVVVQREGLSDEQKVKLALYDNRSAELADWDVDVLKEIGPLILESVFTTDELADLLDDTAGGELEGEDSVPEPPEFIVSKLGDLYQLGGHRLLCGDSTAQTAVDRLMAGEKADMVFTDPPYGMNLDTDWSGAKSSLKFANEKGLKGGKKYKPVIGDSEDFDPAFIFEWFADCKEILLWGADYYAERLHSKNDGSWFVWDKRLDESADRMYGSCFELCWSKAKHKRDMVRVKWAGVFGTEKEPEKSRCHPTQKPIALVEWFLTKYGNGSVVDLFGGSGSTLIACEKLNRRCYMMELDPQYCDVIVKRFNNLFPDREILRNGEAFQPVSDERQHLESTFSQRDESPLETRSIR